MNTVRERILAEITRRLAVGEFDTVEWGAVIRTDLPESYNASEGSVLSITEGREEYLPTAGRSQDVRLAIYLTFAVPLAEGEEAATVANNVTGELVKALSGQKSFELDGQTLQFLVSATASEPNLTDELGECASAIVEFSLRYRTVMHDLFAA